MLLDGGGQPLAGSIRGQLYTWDGRTLSVIGGKLNVSSLPVPTRGRRPGLPVRTTWKFARRHARHLPTADEFGRVRSPARAGRERATGSPFTAEIPELPVHALVPPSAHPTGSSLAILRRRARRSDRGRECPVVITPTAVRRARRCPQEARLRDRRSHRSSKGGRQAHATRSTGRRATTGTTT